ncbi:MAG: CocE/NonD family hydrolase [Steroidobacteraceae bacterium]
MSVHVEEHVWITLSDGCRLGARLWLPQTALRDPVPAVLEYIPYRKRDGTRARDEPMHGYYAEHGYAAIRVDMRGSGESDGLLTDEYLKQEQDDALEVIAWIAKQPWCSGAVGMQGKSWGGFNALQVAARRPPALKAIITAFSTDNRYTDDIHYMGGCLLNDNLWWGSIMLAYQSRPLDPQIVGSGWRKQWLERIERLPFFPALWLSHQRYDDYWKHGSVCEDYPAIECPVLAIGGWSDAYTNAVPRLLEQLKVPRLGIIGPWGHLYPHDGVPGPAIGFLQEAVRWWDHWLKGRDTGIMNEPMLRAYLEDPVAPDGTRTFIPGRWVGEPSYPSPNIRSRRLHLHADRSLGEEPDASSGVLAIRSPQSHGESAGEWMATGCPGEQATDQRLDDGGALVFDTTALDEEICVLGSPVLRLQVSADAPVAQLSVRLSDIAPDERITRVSYQVLNLAHRESHECPSALEPGRYYDVTLALNACGHRFPPGHRLRLSIATAHWPLIWPAPYAARISVRTSGGTIELPVRQGDPEPQVSFERPVHGPQTPVTRIDPGVVRRFSIHDHVTGEATYVTEGIGGLFGEGILRFDEIDVQVAHSLKREFTIKNDDPLSARYVLTQTYDMGRDGWGTLINTRTEMRSDKGNFYVSGTLIARHNGEIVAERQWDAAIARDLM